MTHPSHPTPEPQTPHARASIAVRGSPLLTYIHSKFREVFGPPYSTLELDSQWSLRSTPQAPAIFVLVNGSYEKPAVWIFDPYDAENVWRTSITCDAEVDSSIQEIKRRFKAATASWKGREG